MALSSGLGYVNFINGDGENRPVRCGRMYYTCFLPICGLFRSKTSPVYHVKKSAIFYVRRILGWIGAIKAGLN